MKQKQVRVLAEELLLSDVFDFSSASKDLLKLSASYNQQIRKAMEASLSSDKAFDLLERYDEINHEIHEAERLTCILVGMSVGIRLTIKKAPDDTEA